MRKNSNISTGGDSIDVSDKINVRFKSIAIDVVKTLGLNIAGVDMIINNDKYVILEVNFNPAIHIHTYPLIGVNRRPALALLKALGFDEKNNV